MHRRGLCLLVVSLTACQPPAGPVGLDAPAFDAAPLDTAAPDTAALDTAALDTPAQDASEASDAPELDAMSLDTGASDGGDVGDAPRDASPAIDAGARTCAASCDCPAGTVCTIEGTCSGSECTEECGSDADCPCGRACVDGFCDFPVGSLSACTLDCDCPMWERCSGGRCVRACTDRFRCDHPADCDACGRVCDHFTSRCVAPDECWCDSSCVRPGLEGTLCDDTHRCTTPEGALVTIAPGDFVMIPPGDAPWPYELTGMGTVASTGTAGRVTVVADLNVVSSSSLQGWITGPDREERRVSFSWECGAGGARWTGTVDLAGMGVPRAGAWQLLLAVTPLDGPTTPHADGIWLYVAE
jgi:hypothetical protein